MEIRFCELCQESIPDADFETAKAVLADGRTICATCIARRALAGGGGAGRGWLTLLVALAALGGVVWLLAAQGKQPGVPSAVATAIKEQGAQTLADADARAKAALTPLQAQLARTGELTVAVERVAADLTGLAERTAAERAELQGRLDRFEGRMVTLERQVGEVHAWLRELQSRAAAPPSPAPEPVPAPAPEPVPAPEPTPEPAAPKPSVPAAPTTDAATLQHWIDLLKDPNAGIAFSATLELGRLKDVRAVPALTATLKTYRDFYVRLGAADALRELKACDGVGALIEALDDKDDLVRTAANQALMFITGHQEPFAANLPKTELRRAQKGWEKWWKENEDGVRTRMAQPKQP